ncbi:MAG TPA: FAD-dependent oxidoreductase [Polyangia bacterium]|nr:FAD-dependent oxidoreductase [Polyangia bacterium]
MNRRTFLAAGLAAPLPLALALGLPGCRPFGSRSAATPVPPSTMIKRLPKVQIRQDRMIRIVTGLRPYRPSGFVVRAEKLGEKLLVHNYGHGGGGVTLSWGSAHLAVEEAVQSGARRYAVLGCGVVGLSTAILLQRRGLAVTMYAKDRPPNTTSNAAGAQWSPFSVFDSHQITPAFADQLERASRLSYRYFQDLVGDAYGVRWIPNYEIGSEPIHVMSPEGPFGRFLDLYPSRETLAPPDNPFGTAYGLRFMTMFIETPVYLNALLRDFLVAGGRIETREFQAREELLGLPEPVIVNCTGLGSRTLFGDEALGPIKGQLVFLLPQAEIDYIVISGHSYMFPRRDGILLGGSFEHDNWDLAPDPQVTERILAEHRLLFERMA